MMPIGSEVIYSGKKWINAVRETQPVWGLQKSKENDEVNNSYSTQIPSNTKTFADYLKEAKEK